MTVTHAPEDCAHDLDSSLQVLIETRLDILDRVLLGRVSRPDRLAILREVESQIEELIAQKEPGSLTRTDLLEILGRIDPPEAYLPDEYNEAPTRSFRPRPSSPRLDRAQPARPTSRTGLLGGILGLASIVSLFLIGGIALGAAMLLQSEPVFIMGIVFASLFGIAGGISSMILGIQGRKEGAMAIIGIVAGSLAVISSVVMPVVLALLFLG